jgi:hypothetical protein
VCEIKTMCSAKNSLRKIFAMLKYSNTMARITQFSYIKICLNTVAHLFFL